MNTQEEIHDDSTAQSNAEAQEINTQVLPTNKWLRPFYNNIWSLGLFLLTLALLTSWYESNHPKSNDVIGVFPFTFLMVFFYTVALLLNKRLKWWLFGCKPAHYDTFFIYLAIWLGSCFSLNRSLPIFNESSPWLTTHLFISCFVCILYAWKDLFSPLVKSLWLAAMAWTSILMLYYTCYLLPVTMYGTLVFWFFGLSLHAYIPLVFTVHIGRVLMLEWEETKNSKTNWYILTGLFAPILLFLSFLFMWSSHITNLKESNQDSILNKGHNLPAWVFMSQRLKRDWISERVLKSEIYYQVPNRNRDFFDMPFGNRQDITKQHDPLVYLAQMLKPAPKLDEGERIHLLKSFFDARHELQPKFWSGKDLITESVVTHATIDAAQRLAYTEKTLSIKNEIVQRWGGQQEAFYTFYLPEGAVVSSLSLWINGKEELARFAAKSKADSAYAAIVGRERRDPSIVHWQEGNTVTVRVFPCTPDANRQFKIGVTSPLKATESGLMYENITFQGPSAASATEAIRLELSANSTVLQQPSFLKNKANNILESKNHYATNWNLTLNKTNFEEKTFSFNGKSYKATSFEKEKSAFNPENIYLDLNTNWTKSELDEILKNSNTTKIKYWTGKQFQEINEANSFEVLEEIGEIRYSLFPFHLLSEPTKALVISKNKGISPNLADLKDSEFGDEMLKRLSEAQHINTFHLGELQSPYLRSLSEFRMTNLHSGKLDELIDLLKNKQFYAYSETQNSIILPNNGVRVSTFTGNAPKNGSEHLLRLFAYNDLMRQIGPYVMNKRYEPEKLVEQAEEAFIVTPVSSLLVLETEADYQRFDIKKSQNSLENASINGSGAVPEPHEWLLICLLFLSILWVWRIKI
jgi:XrtN system VIT domain protein